MTTLPNVVRCSSFDQFQSFAGSDATRRSEIDAFEADLVRELDSSRCRDGAPSAARTLRSTWTIGRMHKGTDGRRRPNWRERLVCPSCHLNNRMRAALAFLLAESNWLDKIYLTEATTQLSRIAFRRRPRTVGSEYLRDGTEPGAINARGIRHEDATRLSFAARSFHHIGSFDVLEHVPAFRQALAEFFRCLKPSGKLLLTVPFVLGSPTTITRAVVQPDESIKHLLPPEIHGDPLASEGALCFYHFGWDLIEQLRSVGFREAALLFYWSAELGYLGGYQFVITARRPAAP